jgi:nicotinate phosphoribosyltransferase
MTNPYVSALFTDLYELTMAASYFQHRMCAPATFSLFVRALPSERRSFLVAAGIEEVLHVLETFSFTTEDIEFLRDTGRFPAPVLEYLAQLRFTGDVHALPEGSLCFAQEPLIEVTGPIIEAQLIETVVLNAIHLQTLIASKAARSVIAAEGRSVIDFSLRRTQGTDAGLKVARASYLAGFDGTSNVLASRLYGLPMYGTMAHSFIESFEDEEAAFHAYAATFPDDTALLIDTYDTVSGARKAARVGQALLQRGHRLRGVRLDSGDLLALSRHTRTILDEAGLPFTRIYASGGLDEYHVARLVHAGAPIDVFCVGTAMGVSSDAPSLDMAYKLVEYQGRPRLKLSSGKVSLVSQKQIFRILGPDGYYERDLIGLREETVEAVAREAGVSTAQVVPLLQPLMSQGQRLQPSASLRDSRTRCADDLKGLFPDLRALSSIVPYPVTWTRALTAVQEEAMAYVRLHNART